MRAAIFIFTILTSLSSLAQLPDVQWLKDNAVAIKELGADHSDLAPLKKSIGDAQVVILAASNLGMGSTMMEKVRITQFLHDEMGFNTLVLDGDFRQSAEAWYDFASGLITIDSAVKKIDSRVWDSKEFQPMMGYIDEQFKKDTPLRLAGILPFSDFGAKHVLPSNLYSTAAEREDSIKAAAYINDFRDTIVKYGGSVPEDWYDVKAFFIYSWVHRWEETRSAYAPGQVTKYCASLRLLIRELPYENTHNKSGGQATNEKLEVFVMEALYITNYFDKAYKYENRDDIERHDGHLAVRENLAYQKEYYSDKGKVVIWCAPGQAQWITGGKSIFEQIVEDDAGQSIFTIGFTSYSGDVGITGQPARIYLDKAKKKTLEAACEAAGLQTAYIDLQPLRTGLPCKKYPGHGYGFRSSKECWHELFDALIFNREGRPGVALHPMYHHSL